MFDHWSTEVWFTMDPADLIQVTLTHHSINQCCPAVSPVECSPILWIGQTINYNVRLVCGVIKIMKWLVFFRQKVEGWKWLLFCESCTFWGCAGPIQTWSSFTGLWRIVNDLRSSWSSALKETSSDLSGGRIFGGDIWHFPSTLNFSESAFYELNLKTKSILKFNIW